MHNRTPHVAFAPTTRLLNALCLVTILASTAPTRAASPNLTQHDTPYYVLHTDLDPQGVQEVTQRITLMAEEYHTRTKGIGGTVNHRLPFYMFTDEADYIAAGGMPGSAGVYMGVALMAVVDLKHPERCWHVIQHEGFHQFVHAAIGRGIPIWANEGMAEYFGHGIWTGDRFLVGFIPPERLARIQTGIRNKKLKSLHEMMHTSHELWNAELSAQNYDLAWSMVHFLAHAENGRYEQRFMRFVRNVANGTEWPRAWRQSFGTDTTGFQKRWEEYWLGLSSNPTADLYAQVAVEILNSFYARALVRKQRFDSVDEFFAAARNNELECHPEDWLPPTLLKQGLEMAPDVGEWSLKKKRGFRWLQCRTPAGTLLEGRFKSRNRRAADISVRILNNKRRH